MVDGYEGIPKIVFIADRGYESYNNIAHVKEFRDFIDLDKNLLYLLKSRVLRFPVSGTQYECLIKNLPWDEFIGSDLKYCMV